MSSTLRDSKKRKSRRSPPLVQTAHKRHNSTTSSSSSSSSTTAAAASSKKATATTAQKKSTAATTRNKGAAAARARTVKGGPRPELSSMPQNVQLQILSHLTVPDMLCAEAVCKSWHRALSRPKTSTSRLLWNRAIKNTWPTGTLPLPPRGGKAIEELIWDWRQLALERWKNQGQPGQAEAEALKTKLGSLPKRLQKKWKKQDFVKLDYKVEASSYGGSAEDYGFHYNASEDDGDEDGWQDEDFVKGTNRLFKIERLDQELLQRIADDLTDPQESKSSYLSRYEESQRRQAVLALFSKLQASVSKVKIKAKQSTKKKEWLVTVTLYSLVDGGPCYLTYDNTQGPDTFDEDLEWECPDWVAARGDDDDSDDHDDDDDDGNDYSAQPEILQRANPGRFLQLRELLCQLVGLDNGHLLVEAEVFAFFYALLTDGKMKSRLLYWEGEYTRILAILARARVEGRYKP